MLVENGSSGLLSAPDDGEGMTTSRLGTFLLGLSLALALPPTAMAMPPNVVLPTIHPKPSSIVTAGEVAALLGHPASEVGRGRVAAGEIDGRLEGLLVSLDVLRLSGGPSALVSVSIVESDPALLRPSRSTPNDLWTLATLAVARLRSPGWQRIDLGDDAFLRLHADRTAQAAWRASDQVATVSITHLAEDKEWLIAATRALANLVADRLGAQLALTS